MADCDEIMRNDFNMVTVALQRKIDIIVAGESKDIKEAQSEACCTSDELQISKDKNRTILANIRKIMNTEYFSKRGGTMCENIHNIHEKDRALIKSTFEICVKYQGEKVEAHVLEQEANCIKEYILEMMPSQIKESLEILSPPERFIWCAILLVNFHSSTECSEFMSSAFKFILKVLNFKIRCSNIYKDTDMLSSLFTNYAGRIQENNCDACVMVNAIKVFHTTEDSKTSFFRNEIDMEYVLKSCQAENFNLFQFFGSVMYMKETPLYLTDFCLNSRKYDTFTTLLQFGVVDCYNSKYYKDLREFFKKSGEDYIFLIPRRSYSKKTLRLREYYCHCSDLHERIDVVRALKYLWATTSEPYFGLSELYYSFPFQEVWFSEMIWQWYDKYVVASEAKEMSPRSLLHLSRCAIRSCLALNFQLPVGVESLHLPQNLKDFLQLKECEVNTIQKDS